MFDPFELADVILAFDPWTLSFDPWTLSIAPEITMHA